MLIFSCKPISMDLQFSSRRLERQCCEQKKTVRTWGPNQARLIWRRLDQLRAAETLDIMPKLGRGRCHALRGARAGQFSLDLEHPYRLLIEPTNDQVPQKPDGGIDIRKVTAVRILGVEDTHG